MMDEGTSRDNGGCRLDGDVVPGPHGVGDLFLVWRRHLWEQLLGWLHVGDWVFALSEVNITGLGRFGFLLSC